MISLEQISETGNLDSNLILRQYQLDLMARFMEIKSVKPKLGQDQKPKKLSFSSSTLQRYRNDKNMLSPYRIPPGNHKRRRKISKTNLGDESHCEYDLKRSQMTANDLKNLNRLNSLNSTQTQTLLTAITEAN